ncbi:MAG TPA: MATE family efflux transporter [Candidatus Moranbacteria bacterium]|nr:MAG: MatE-like protein domain efflux pump [Candidatus Moranbacteria bacterium GW2011_GWF1_34_10]HBI17227.1 MATE family efflux transporter [Candidatus Moranbacteria bacterium]
MKNNNLTDGNIPQQIKMIAVPASVGFFFNTMYNVVDTYFGGLVSTDALAALSLSFPVFFMIIALGSGISSGSTALIANALGAQDEKRANLYALQALSFSVIISLFLTVAGYLVAPYLFKILGAEGAYLSIATEYINIILLGSVFFGLTFVINGILNAEGDTKTFRNFLIFGFFLNCLFDPMFMFGWFGFPALGLAGVAWATVLIQLLGVIYMGRILAKRNVFCRGCWHLFYPQKKYFKEIARQGFPASLNLMTVAIGVFIITYFVAPFGKAAVAAYGIATRIDQIAVMPSIGLNVAALTLVGQNNGAKKFDRCLEVFKIVIRYGLFLSLIGIAGVYFFAEKLMAFFTDDPEVINTGVHYLYISILVYAAYTILYIVVSVLQGFKKPNFALWIGTYRQILAPMIFFYVFSQVMGWGIDGVWWGIFAINWTAVIISLLYAKRIFEKIVGNNKKFL